MMRTLFVVSAMFSPDRQPPPDEPRKDFWAITQRLNADVLDWTNLPRMPLGRSFGKIRGSALLQAYAAAARRHNYDVILTDGEHIGIPLALLLKQYGARTPLVTLGHRLSSGSKRPFFQFAQVQRQLSRVIVHSRYQQKHAIAYLGLHPQQVTLMPYQIDVRFWRPMPASPEPLVVSAGLEYRDYSTLYAAAAGLPIRVIIGAASHWSRQKNSADPARRPANVEVDSFDYRALRDLYARAAIVVVPLKDVDFQAGITTILEAMAMGKPVIVTRTRGQTDVVEDRRSNVRGVAWQLDAPSLLRTVAEQAGIPVEANGLYVPPNDAETLRRTITYLLDHPDLGARLGAAGRRMVEQLMTVELFADRVAHVVEEAAS